MKRCPVGVVLSVEDFRLAEAYGEAMQDFLRTELAKKATRGTKNYTRDIYTAEAQADFKAAEIAVARALGLEPRTYVKFCVGYADGYVDIVTPGGIRIDVKSTQPHNFRFCWPVLKTSKFEKAGFDRFVIASGSRYAWEIHGHISKDDFREHCTVSDGKDGMEAGTWWLNFRDSKAIDRRLNLK